jgi:transcription elongation GreA/GreB family factor
MTEKDRLHAHCLALIHQRIQSLQEEIQLVQASANEETKSSAGDKYETGRAMAQNEVAQYIVQLAELERQSTALQRLAEMKAVDRVIPGSLVTASQAVFYISISLGKVSLNGKEYLVVSPDSPIGKTLLGKSIGEVIRWQHQEMTVLTVL